MYESLRAAVVEGRARPEGLEAVIYHGLVHGLSLLAGSTCMGTIPRPMSANVVSRNPELLHVLANMVLQTQSEMMHVY
jgi:hypothetical protein